jgi:DNA-binding MarR family transcriptional regulator
MPDSVLRLPDDARDLSATARLAAVALAAADHALAREELLARTAASTDSLWRALTDLEEEGLVEREDHPVDARRTRWRLVEGDS